MRTGPKLRFDEKAQTIVTHGEHPQKISFHLSEVLLVKNTLHPHLKSLTWPSKTSSLLAFLPQLTKPLPNLFLLRKKLHSKIRFGNIQGIKLHARTN